MKNKILSVSCSLSFSLLTECSVHMLGFPALISYNLERWIPNPTYVGRCDGGHAVSVSATQALNQVVVFSKI